MAERAIPENYASMAGDVDVEAKGGQRRKSAGIGQHRRSTVVVENPQLVEGDALNAADRALAEMGYVQVSLALPHNLSPADCATSLSCISESSHGYRVSPSLYRCPVSSPVSPRRTFTLWRLEARLRRYGPGCKYYAFYLTLVKRFV